MLVEVRGLNFFFLIHVFRDCNQAIRLECYKLCTGRATILTMPIPNCSFEKVVIGYFHDEYYLSPELSNTWTWCRNHQYLVQWLEAGKKQIRTSNQDCGGQEVVA